MSSPIRTIETRQHLAAIIARTVAEQQLIQHEDATAKRILSTPFIRNEPAEVYPSPAAKHASWNTETAALIAYLQVDPLNYTTAALRLRPYGMLAVKDAAGQIQWWKRQVDGYILCPLSDVMHYRGDEFDFRWRRLYRCMHGRAMGNPYCHAADG